MNTAIKTGLAAILLLALSCKKENVDRQSALTANNGSDIVAGKSSINIGTQVWMQKNLDVGHYRNGDPIPHVKKWKVWDTLTTGAWCWFNNDSATGAVYGKLYNWYAVHDPRGLAPSGWHIPSDSEWLTLATFLGGSKGAGGKLKDTGTIEAGTGLWLAPNAGATNSSGFTALPGGRRALSYEGGFYEMGYFGFWWTSTKYGTYAWNARMVYSDKSFINEANKRSSGFSVRCIKD